MAWYLSRRELRGLMKDTSLEGIVAATERYTGRGFYAREARRFIGYGQS